MNCRPPEGDATAGVPTVWLMLLSHMAAAVETAHLRMVVCGGSACRAR
jgi:fatty-acyl-CoA synthase